MIKATAITLTALLLAGCGDPTPEEWYDDLPAAVQQASENLHAVSTEHHWIGQVAALKNLEDREHTWYSLEEAARVRTDAPPHLLALSDEALKEAAFETLGRLEIAKLGLKRACTAHGVDESRVWIQGLQILHARDTR